MSPMTPKRRLLVGLSSLADPAILAFLRALPAEYKIDVCPVGAPAPRARVRKINILAPDAEAFAAGVQRAAARGRYESILIVDHPATRPAIRGLTASVPHVPVVLVMLGCEGQAEPADARRLVAPREIWSFSPGKSASVPAGLLPNSFHRRAAADAGWIRRRLAALSSREARLPSVKALTTIVIPCWNGLRYTRQCLASVRRWTPAPYEIVVIDNGSKDGTARHVRSLRDRRIRLIRNARNLGFAKAVNQGMARARGRYIVWLNSDVIVAPGWLERLVSCAERASWVGAVGPYTNEINGLQRWEEVGYKNLSGLPQFAESLALRNAGRARRAHRLTGFCLLVKTEAVRRVGLLDEDFGAGCYEDFDYCLRLRLAGYELLLAEDVYVHHFGHKTFDGNGLPRGRANMDNRERFIEKWCRRALEFLDELDPHLVGRRR